MGYGFHVLKHFLPLGFFHSWHFSIKLQASHQMNPARRHVLAELDILGQRSNFS